MAKSEGLSSDEETQRIKEAIDLNFLTEELYKGSGSKQNYASPKSLSSLKNKKSTDGSTNPFSIKVTPEFQRHVSHHLSRLMDKIIDDSDTFLHTEGANKKRPLSKVKLLSTSKHYLNLENIKCMKHKPSCGNFNDDYMAKAKEVAVTPKWVLSKKETEWWTPNTKGTLEIIKFSNKRKEKVKKLK